MFIGTGKLQTVRHLFVFGDSYSTTSIDGKFKYPTDELPMSDEWPGFPVCEYETPNYIGYLLAETQREGKTPPLHVINYAIRGHIIQDQVQRAKNTFLTGAGATPRPAEVPWVADSSLFIILVGTNDCGRPSKLEWLTSQVDVLIELLDIIYGAGARNILIMGIPPIDRAPVARNSRLRVGQRVKLFNQSLFARLTALQNDTASPDPVYPDLNLMLFPFFAMFSQVLNNPVEYGFKASDASTVEQEMTDGIWWDHIHPTAAFHKIWAMALIQFLKSEGSKLEGSD